MSNTARDFDAAEYLEGPAAQAEYLAAALETNDAEFIRDAVGDVIRARGMTEIARESGIKRTSLYRAFGKGGNPTLDSMLAVFQALNVQLSAVTAESEKTRAVTKASAKRNAGAKRAASVKKKAVGAKKATAKTKPRKPTRQAVA